MKYFTPTKLSENIHETPEGYLVCIGVPIARTGVMDYGEGETPLETENGKVEIYRSEEEVFRPETIASFEGKAVTITHPTEFVSPQNWSQLAKGLLQNVRRGEGAQKDDLIADLLITDATAIFLVKNGLREVSCGYEAEYSQTEEGKGVQTNIIGNHLALVDQGRAGSAYAINDHKGKGIKMSLKDRIKAIFAKAQDEAMKMAEDGGFEKNEEKKDDAKSKDAGVYDELVQMCKDLSAKVDLLSKPKDEAADPKEVAEGKAGDDEKDGDEKKAAVEKKDDAKDDSVAPAIEDRLKALEASVAKLMEMQAGDEENPDVGEGEAEDDDFDETTMTGDTASRAEILSPGIELSKEVKVKALKASYATKEGKKVIDSLTAGKPTFDSAEKVDTLFVAASELLKLSRTRDLASTKSGTSDSVDQQSKASFMTPEKLNEINQKFYNKN